MITRWSVSLPEATDLPALPRGIVLHWSAGTHRANPIDLAAYHYIIEGDGKVRQGKYAVAANMRQLSGEHYAAHTGGYNSFQVGLSAAGMKGYRGPDDVGPYPLTEPQVRRLCELAGYFCDLGGLDPLNPKHLCTHREVWTIHRVKGVRNDQKRDIDHLPFMPLISADEVGDTLRGLTALLIGRVAPELNGSLEISYPPPPIIGRRVYSPSLGYLYVARYSADNDWSFVKQADLENLFRTVSGTRAGTRLSQMPEHP